MNQDQLLADFAAKNGFSGKGHLCVALHITRLARKKGLPIREEDLLARSNGQVAGLGRAAIQRILADHGIQRILAEEGGRTSRGSIDYAQRFSAFLNAHLEFDLESVENWWAQRVREFFESRPFVLHFDPAKSLSNVQDLLNQATKRQQEHPGATYAGTVLQHLIGAKLQIVLPDHKIEHHGASVSDIASSRPGDFVIANTAIHATTSPSKALLRKCKANLNAGLKPLIITIAGAAVYADTLANGAGIADRVDVFEAVQFIAGNLYELSGFSTSEIRVKTADLIEVYNRIVNEHERDQSLLISIL